MALSNVSSNDQVYYPCLLLTGGPEQEKKFVEIPKDATSLVTPDIKNQRGHLQVGGPLWAGVWLFLMHCLIGLCVSSFSHVPYIGESPLCLRAIILIAAIGNGFFDHIGGYIAHRQCVASFEALRNGAVLFGLIGTLLFFCHVFISLPAWESNGLLVLFVGILVAPAITYKMITAKDAPTTYSDLLDSYTSWSGIVLHLSVDTGLAIFFAFCSTLLPGTASTMCWLQ